MARVLLAIVLVAAGCGGGGGGKASDARADKAKDAVAEAAGGDVAGEVGGDAASDATSSDAGSDGSPDAAGDAATDEGASASDAADAGGGDTPGEGAGGDTAGNDAGDAGGGEARDSADGAGGDVVEAPPPKMITVNFTGKVVTVAQTAGQMPFGFDQTARLASVTGSFAYDPGLPDDKPADPMRGLYDRGLTAFTLTVKTHTITGSGLAILQTENITTTGTMTSDTFRFIDGTQLINKLPRIMKLDGVDAPAVKLFIAISDGTGAMLKSDVLPDPFPTVDIPNTPHTFSLEDSGGTLLMQLDTLTSP